MEGKQSPNGKELVNICLRAQYAHALLTRKYKCCKPLSNNVIIAHNLSALGAIWLAVPKLHAPNGCAEIAGSGGGDKAPGHALREQAIFEG
jgi:hypothetical protein